MKFGDNNVDLSGVDDRRGGRGQSGNGGGGGGGIGAGHVAAAGGISKMLGGGAGMTIVILLLLAMCTQGGGLLGSDTPSQQVNANAYGVPDGAEGVKASLAQKCPADAADGVFENPDCLLVKAYNETNNVWVKAFDASGQQFRAPQLTFFSGATRTACGQGTTNMGPFYCPGDERIYFDLGFNRELQRLGVQGQYALVYIMAHEYGHHMQNVLGIEQRVRQRQQRADRRTQNNYSVAMELQADCMAGVWGRLANDQGNVQITPEEFRQAASAAAAVGDDRIMSGAGMKVNPDNFTHGSAKQREYWYSTGYESGNLNSCNTFQQLGLPL